LASVLNIIKLTLSSTPDLLGSRAILQGSPKLASAVMCRIMDSGIWSYVLCYMK